MMVELGHAKKMRLIEHCWVEDEAGASDEQRACCVEHMVTACRSLGAP
jgi:hypothetical protein